MILISKCDETLALLGKTPIFSFDYVRMRLLNYPAIAATLATNTTVKNGLQRVVRRPRGRGTASIVDPYTLGL